MKKKATCEPATKEDLKLMATKEDLKLMATKEDLKLMATKEDLKQLATKEELKLLAAKMATKEDLKQLATKEELKLLAAKMATKAELKEEIGLARHDLGLAILETHKRIDILEDRLTTRMSTETSRILQAIDAFAGKADSSERAMTLHGRELTEVHVGLKDHERRIAALEARPVP